MILRDYVANSSTSSTRLNTSIFEKSFTDTLFSRSIRTSNSRCHYWAHIRNAKETGDAERLMEHRVRRTFLVFDRSRGKEKKTKGKGNRKYDRLCKDHSKRMPESSFRLLATRLLDSFYAFVLRPLSFQAVLYSCDCAKRNPNFLSLSHSSFDLPRTLLSREREINASEQFETW